MIFIAALYKYEGEKNSKINWELQKEEKVDAGGFSLLSPDELKPRYLLIILAISLSPTILHQYIFY